MLKIDERVHHLASTTFTLDKRFIDLKPIGKGSYGIVCKATNSYTNVPVAIKKITPMSRSIDDAKHVLREVRLMRHLGRHENIVSLVDLTLRACDDELYIVMELLDSDLHRVLQSAQPLSENHFRYFMFQLFCGIKYMHMNRIIHRDLKPGNLLISKDCKLRITDFGLARERPTGNNVNDLEAGINAPMTEHVVTRWYRAPELMLCPDGYYDYSVDIWSAGCILGEMLGRKPLFPGKNFVHQLSLIFDVIGLPKPSEVGHIKNAQAKKFLASQKDKTKVHFNMIYPTASESAHSLLESILKFTPEKRFSIADCQNSFFVMEMNYPSPDYPPISSDFEFSYERKAGVSTVQLMKLITIEATKIHSECIKTDRALVAQLPVYEQQRVLQEWTQYFEHDQVDDDVVKVLEKNRLREKEYLSQPQSPVAGAVNKDKVISRHGSDEINKKTMESNSKLHHANTAMNAVAANQTQPHVRQSSLDQQQQQKKQMDANNIANNPSVGVPKAVTTSSSAAMAASKQATVKPLVPKLYTNKTSSTVDGPTVISSRSHSNTAANMKESQYKRASSAPKSRPTVVSSGYGQSQAHIQPQQYPLRRNNSNLSNTSNTSAARVNNEHSDVDMDHERKLKDALSQVNLYKSEVSHATIVTNTSASAATSALNKAEAVRSLQHSEIIQRAIDVLSPERRPEYASNIRTTETLPAPGPLWGREQIKPQLQPSYPHSSTIQTDIDEYLASIVGSSSMAVGSQRDTYTANHSKSNTNAHARPVSAYLTKKQSKPSYGSTGRHDAVDERAHKIISDDDEDDVENDDADTVAEVIDDDSDDERPISAVPVPAPVAAAVRPTSAVAGKSAVNATTVADYYSSSTHLRGANGDHYLNSNNRGSSVIANAMYPAAQSQPHTASTGGYKHHTNLQQDSDTEEEDDHHHQRHAPIVPISAATMAMQQKQKQASYSTTMPEPPVPSQYRSTAVTNDYGLSYGTNTIPNHAAVAPAVIPPPVAANASASAGNRKKKLTVPKSPKFSALRSQRMTSTGHLGLGREMPPPPLPISLTQMQVPHSSNHSHNQYPPQGYAHTNHFARTDLYVQPKERRQKGDSLYD